jgi:hypothetical protein
MTARHRTRRDGGLVRSNLWTGNGVFALASILRSPSFLQSAQIFFCPGNFDYFLEIKDSSARAFACITELKHLQTLSVQIVLAVALSLQLFPELFSSASGGEGG